MYSSLSLVEVENFYRMPLTSFLFLFYPVSFIIFIKLERKIVFARLNHFMFISVERCRIEGRIMQEM